ncbi:MAG: DUF2855 family protein [Wenzhouxiangellaceae bacterium]|nr:DUF2855 family protein [Wenzhouxiangellaceae bacterium]
MSERTEAARLLMNRQKFSEMEVEPLTEVPGADDGEVVFRIDRFALTANNVTYATYGDALHYWEFFPVERQGWGQLPVWGYADVVESGVDDIEPGQRYYGYWPAATHLKAQPGKTGKRGFRDDVSHRAGLPEIYNWYQRTDNDPSHDERTEPLHAIFRPLFVTAFCLGDFLAANHFFGASQVLVSSASSKTAYGTAFCIRDHDGIDVIALTSGGNRAFVEKLGLYHSVLDYDGLGSLDAGTPTLYIDIAGNTRLQADVHNRFGPNLVYDCSVGSAQSLVPPRPDRQLSGPRPQFFFAPQWIEKRHKDWGVTEFDRRVGKATAGFYDYVTENRLLKIRESFGLEAAREILRDLLQGRTDPNEGHILRP